METLKELSSLLVLNQLPIAGRRQIKEDFSLGKSPKEILDQILQDPLHPHALTVQEILNRFSPEREIETCHERGIQLLSILDAGYPEILKMIFNPPLLLYVWGTWIPEDQNAIAMVGTRHPSFYGCGQARRFARELSEKGLTIVSGLARGIDQEAHSAALEIPYGRTIGILGCGIDVTYPPGSEKLYQKISERGAVMSEYLLGTPPLAHNFPARNRIISGLSRGVLVIEAHKRSGALITAHEAIDEGRDVFALPGPVDQLTSRGTHRLLKEGAFLIEDPHDVMERILSSLPIQLVLEKDSSTASSRAPKGRGDLDFEIASPSASPPKDGSVQRILADNDKVAIKGTNAHENLILSAAPKILSKITLSADENKILAAIQEKPLAYDSLVETAGLSPVKITGLLTLMELRGILHKQSDGTFARTN